jgi:hypothetical protein
MINLYTFLLVFIFALVIIIAWNGYTFWSLKKHSHLSEKILNDSKYWELKYKYEFIVAIIGLVTATAGFVGYNTFSSIKTELTRNTKSKVDSVELEFNKKVDSISLALQQATGNVIKVKDELSNTSIDLKKYKSYFDHYKIDQKLLLNNSKLSHVQLEALNKQLQIVKNNAILKQPFYFITGYPIKGGDGYYSINFSDLVTVTGLKLPQFKQTPLILFSPSDDFSFIPLKANTLGFKFMANLIGDSSFDRNSIYMASFLILEVPEGIKHAETSQ